MKEEEFLKVIKSVIGDKYVGDDCAYLKDLGILVSQDSLVEDVHFSFEYMTPYQLGYKSAMVNISDIAASGGGKYGGKYILVALSLPKNIKKDFVEEFYEGLNCACKKYGVEVVGGDLTGSHKVVVSITIIGAAGGGRISSRKNAQTGQVVVTSGPHGSSAAGLKILQNSVSTEDKNYKKFISAHLMPEAQIEYGEIISENINEDYAMMDSSDGLADALFKIAEASNKTIVVDFDKIPYEKEIQGLFPNEYKDMVLYGGEDYQLVATVPEDFAKEYNLTIIGNVLDKEKGVNVRILNSEPKDIIIKNLEKSFNHFK